MADSPLIPGSHSRPIAPTGQFAGEWYRFFRDLIRYVQETEGNTAELAALEARVAALEEAGENPLTLFGPYSVQVLGALADGSATVLLENDEAQPLPVSFYATDDSQEKGWHLLQPDWVPNPYADYLVDPDGNYLTDPDGNFLMSQDGFPIPLEYGGTGADNSSVAANLVWASPDGMAGAPVFRALVGDDVPDHNDLNGLQGGAANEYYHLTADEYEALAAPNQLLTGQEYLYAFHTKLIAGTSAKMVFSGDSTTEGGGTGATGDFIISTAMLNQGTQRGHKLTTVNAGHSGASTLDWITTYLATDLAGTPDLYVVRWGLNDPFYGMDITDFETNLRSGLATIRASYGVDDMAVVVMVPNTANDPPNGRDAAWLKQVRVVARQAAKDYLCAFMDTYSLWTDSENAAGLWMDDPFGDGRAIHPKNVFNALIVTKMVELIFPSFLDATRSGTYTPTLTNGANVASSTPSQCQWSRSGNVVTVSGRVDIACTAAANTLTIVGMSLPVASDLTLSGNLAGGGAIGQTTYQTFICLGDTTNNRATLQFLSNGTVSAAAFFSFTYLVQ